MHTRHRDGSNEHDEDLLARFASGDADAFGALYAAYAPAMRVVARMIAGAAEAEDVVHDAFMSVQMRVHRYDRARGNVRAWLMKIVKNRSIDRLRRARTRAALSRVCGSAPAEPDADRVDATRAWARLGELPPEQRRILELAFGSGLAYPEIAELEGVPLGTIKSRAFRALATMRARCAGHNEVAPETTPPPSQTPAEAA